MVNQEQGIFVRIGNLAKNVSQGLGNELYAVRRDEAAKKSQVQATDAAMNWSELSEQWRNLGVKDPALRFAGMVGGGIILAVAAEEAINIVGGNRNKSNAQENSTVNPETANEGRNLLSLHKFPLSNRVLHALGEHEQLNTFMESGEATNFTSEIIDLTLEQVNSLSGARMINEQVRSEIEFYSNLDSANPIHAIVYCENGEFFMSTPIIEVINDQGLQVNQDRNLKKGTHFLFDNTGHDHYLEVGVFNREPTNVAYVVLTDEVRSYFERWLDMSGYENGEIFMLEVITASKKPIQIILEVGTLPLTELAVGSGAIRRRFPNSNAEDWGLSGSDARYVTNNQKSLAEVRAALASNRNYVSIADSVQEESIGNLKRYYLNDLAVSSRKWYYITDMRDGEEIFAWAANSSIQNVNQPNLLATQSAMPEASMATQTPNAPERSQGNFIEARDQSGTFSFNPTYISGSDERYTIGDIDVHYTARCSYLDDAGRERQVDIVLAAYSRSLDREYILGLDIAHSGSFAETTFSEMYATLENQSLPISFMDSNTPFQGDQIKEMFAPFATNMDAFVSSGDPSTIPETQGRQVLFCVSRVNLFNA